jgi:hypothetical protein
VQLSPAILQAPLTLFLGAGASQPLGKPTMAPFVTGLVKKWEKRGSSNLGLFKHLADTCDGDLENILGELDTILHLRSFENLSAFVGGSYVNVDKTIARALRTSIEYEIIQEYSEIHVAEAMKIYKPLFDELFSKIDPDKHCLPIFTTNYDTAIEEFCELSDEYALVDGFRRAARDYVWDAAIFHGFRLVPMKRNVVLFKLHGSVNWMLVRARKEIVRTQPFHQQANASRYENVLIYPATHKVATTEPYFTAYDYYGRCCEHSQVLLTIGYSFRDYDALARLRSSLSFNPSLTVALLSPDCKTILERLPIDHSREVPIELYFGNKETAAIQSTALSNLLSIIRKST